MTTLRKGQVRLGPRTWAAIREAYLAGASAASLAEVYGCSLGTIRYRALHEGWRRCDVAGFEPVNTAPAPAPKTPAHTQPPDEAFGAAQASPKELYDLAVEAAGRALRAGRPSEAGAYLRAAEALQRLDAPEAKRADDPNYIDPEELERRAADLRARAPQILAMVQAKCGVGKVAS